jgi:hypothetical protein
MRGETTCDDLVPLKAAARELDLDAQLLRRRLNTAGLRDRLPNGEWCLPRRVVDIIARTRKSSGYLLPRYWRTHEALLSAAPGARKSKTQTS